MKYKITWLEWVQGWTTWSGTKAETNKGVFSKKHKQPQAKVLLSLSPDDKFTSAASTRVKLWCHPGFSGENQCTKGICEFSLQQESQILSKHEHWPGTSKKTEQWIVWVQVYNFLCLKLTGGHCESNSSVSFSSENLSEDSKLNLPTGPKISTNHPPETSSSEGVVFMAGLICFQCCYLPCYQRVWCLKGTTFPLPMWPGLKGWQAMGGGWVGLSSAVG